MKVEREELRSCRQSGLCSVFPFQPMRELYWRGAPQVGDACPYQQAPFTRRTLRPRPAPLHPLLRVPAPPREGARRLLAALEGSGGRAPAWLGCYAPAESVPRPLAPDCPLRRSRWLPSCLRSRGCGARAVAPPVGHGCPEQVMGRRGCSARRSATAARVVGSTPGCSCRRCRGPPGCVTRSPCRPLGASALCPRHLAGRWGRGRRGRGRAAARGTLWGSLRTRGEAAGPSGGREDVQVEGRLRV